MRIAMLTTSFPLTRHAVSGIFVMRLIQHMPSGIHTTVITPCSTDAPVTDNDLKLDYNVRCFRYAPRRWQVLAHGPGGILTAVKNHRARVLLVPLFLIAMFIATLRAARHADIIHANWSINGVIAGMAGILCRTPVLTTLRGSDVALANKSRLFHMILRACMRLSTRIVTVGHGLATAAATLVPRHAAKIVMIPNGVDMTLMNLAPSKIPTGEFRLTTIANLIPGKGVDIIIQAMGRLENLTDFSLSVIGDGPERERLEKLSASIGVAARVKFTGSISPTDIPSYLAKTDLFILASFSEGRPNVILEAFAAAVPVVASNIDGVNELVAHGTTGLLFKAGDPQDLARQIQRLYSDKKLLSTMKTAARRYIEENELTWPATAARYVDLYTQILTLTRPG